MSERSLKECLARFMDPQAFVPIAAPTKRTSPEFAHRQAEKRKVRREIAMKRAEAAIRFFAKPGNTERLLLTAQAIEARRAETGTGSVVDESTVPEGNAPISPRQNISDVLIEALESARDLLTWVSERASKIGYAQYLETEGHDDRLWPEIELLLDATQDGTLASYRDQFEGALRQAKGGSDAS